MAYQTIGTYILGETIQEEIMEGSTLVQQGFRYWAELKVEQNINAEDNTSDFKANVYLGIENGSNGNPIYIDTRASNFRLTVDQDNDGGVVDYYDQYNHETDDEAKYWYSVNLGETKTVFINSFDSTSSDIRRRGGNQGRATLIGTHYLDGTFGCLFDTRWVALDPNFIIFDLVFNGRCTFNVADVVINGVKTTKGYIVGFSDIRPTPLSIDRAVHPSSASNFSDEENAKITCVAVSGISYVEGDYREADTIASLQAALSFDGVTADIPYRDIPIGVAQKYTFEFTEAEREILRQKAQGATSVPIYYLVKVSRQGYSETLDFVSVTQRNLTIVGCNPTLNPTVKDIKEETLALTGDENTFVRYESMAEYTINATASKHATIISQSAQCGSKVIKDLPQGVIDDTESGTFIFYALDSRGLAVQGSVFKNFVEYVKPTCYQKVEIELSEETNAKIKLTINGNYFNGSFGAVDNELKLEVRHTQNDGTMGDWIELTDGLIPVFNGNTYKLETTISGFTYSQAYDFQCRATDKLNVVETSQYTIRLLPVFDWGEADFNFNVPVNINAEDLSMHNETIIRHSNSTNNTVLSASNGNIYVRPGGTDDTYGETIFYANGNVKFNGTVTFADGSTGGGASDPTDAFADYVIEIGEEAMGSNGTWYWRKWNSGKAEAWGCRNFGNMAVTTAWGNLYRSAVLTQNLPDNVFIRTPDAININIVHATFGGWICKHEQTAPSAATTGSFIFVRPASATVTAPTNIGFYIVGEWK